MSLLCFSHVEDADKLWSGGLTSVYVCVCLCARAGAAVRSSVVSFVLGPVLPDQSDANVSAVVCMCFRRVFLRVHEAARTYWPSTRH